MAELFLICEGPTNGLDLRVLDLVIAQKLGKNVSINAAGGETSLGSVATWLEEKSRPLQNGTLGQPIDRAYSIEDRNYRSTQEAESRWIPGGKRFMWRRHEIENYLLDARIVARAFQTLRPEVDTWPGDFPSTTDEVSNLLNTLAETVLEHYIGWLTYWSLVDEKKRRGNTRIDWPSPPLSEYGTRDQWLEYLARECLRAKNESTTFASLAEFDENGIADLYDQLRADSIARGRLLEDVGGHELMSALLSHMNRNKISHISLSLFESELIKALDHEYIPGYFEPDDFVRLADRLV
jgi:hypothetical protein